MGANVAHCVRGADDMHFYTAHGRLFCQIKRFPRWFVRLPWFRHSLCLIGGHMWKESKIGRLSIIAP